MTALRRTLGDIRSDIQSRLGFGMAGEAGVVNAPIIDSFIRNGQAQLYEQFEWRRLITFEERLMGVEQSSYDYPTDCEPENLINVAILQSGIWTELHPGITWDMRSNDSTGAPCRFEVFEQMEVWPAPDQQYTMRRYYKRSLGALNADNDRTTLDSNLVFLHALTNAKLHYRQPDAQTYSNQLSEMLSKLKARNRTKTVFRRESSAGTIPFPKVVGRD